MIYEQRCSQNIDYRCNTAFVLFCFYYCLAFLTFLRNPHDNFLLALPNPRKYCSFCQNMRAVHHIVSRIPNYSYLRNFTVFYEFYNQSMSLVFWIKLSMNRSEKIVDLVQLIEYPIFRIPNILFIYFFEYFFQIRVLN